MNHMHKTNSKFTFFTMLFFLMLSSTAFSNEQSYIELNSGYISETFKSGDKSELAYAGTSIGHNSDRSFFNVNIPYYYLSQADSRENGIGDITLTMGRNIYQSGKGFFANISAGVKLPTADSEKGLGTGSTDYAGYVNIGQNIGRYSFYLYGGYTLTGGSYYSNVTTYGLSISRFFQSSVLAGSLERRSPLASGYEREIVFRTDYMFFLNKKYALKFGGLLGSDGDNRYRGLNAGFITFF